MKKYEITDVNVKGIDCIITLLDYMSKISDVLKSVRLDDKKGKTVLIDTTLCSGDNEYRFIRTTVTSDGQIDLDDIYYTVVSFGLLKASNEALKRHKDYLSNSVLTKGQVEKIIAND